MNGQLLKSETFYNAKIRSKLSAKSKINAGGIAIVEMKKHIYNGNPVTSKNVQINVLNSQNSSSHQCATSVKKVALLNVSGISVSDLQMIL